MDFKLHYGSPSQEVYFQSNLNSHLAKWLVENQGQLRVYRRVSQIKKRILGLSTDAVSCTLQGGEKLPEPSHIVRSTQDLKLALPLEKVVHPPRSKNRAAIQT